MPAPAPPPPPVVAAPPAPATPPVDVIGPRAPLSPGAVTEPPTLAPPPTTPPVAASQRGKFVVLNFDNADVETVIHAASEIVGFNYVLAPDVRGKVTVQTSGRIPQEDVFGVLLAILELHGFTAIKAGNLYKIVRIEGARERAVPTIIGSSPDPQRANSDEVITQIVPLKYSSATDLGNLVRPLMSTRGGLIAHRETNVLIITDTASNVRRLLDIVRLVDVEVAVEELTIIPVRYADAGDLEAILTRLFQTGRLRTAGTPGAPAPAAPQPAPVPGAPPRPPTAAVPDTGGAADRIPLIAAVRRSNSLIVHGRKHEIELVRKLVNQLDVNIYGGRRVFIYYAENAKAKDLTATLNAIYTGKETVPTATSTPTTPRRAGDPVPPPPPAPTVAPGAPVGGGTTGTGGGSLEGEVRFIADETTNAVIVTTFPHNWTEIEATIRQLDKMPRQVLIEVLVAEIQLSDDMRLGLDWAIRSGSIGASQFSSNSPDATAIPTSPVAPAGGGAPTGTITAPSTAIPISGTARAFGPVAAGLTALTLGTGNIFAILNALASNNRINVLSNPHVMTSENKKAVINVSDSIPIITGQQTGTLAPTTVGGTTTTTGGVNQTVEYKDAGVILTVTPRIGERGTVALDIKQEVNDVGIAEAPTGSRRITKREAETSIVLVNNQTLVLGGLIRERTSNEHRGIPLLKDIPIIGYLFGTRARTTARTELLLLITPRVIGTALDAGKITEQMQKVTPEIDRAMRNTPRPPTPHAPGAQVPGAQVPGPAGVTVIPGAPAPTAPPASGAPPAIAPPPPPPPAIPTPR